MTLDPTDAIQRATEGDPETAAATGSLAGRLRAKAAQLATETHVVAVPGWDGELLLRVRRPSPAESKQIVGQLRRNKSKFAAAFIASCTVELIAVEDGNETSLGTWAEVGATHLGLPEGSTTTDAIETVLPADGLRSALVGEISDWVTGQRTSLEDELGK